MTRKILIVGPAWVGDMVMAQTLFQHLKREDPSISLDVLASAWTFSLLKRMPEVNHSLELPFAHGELSLSKRLSLAKTLRGQYDQAIVLPNSFKAALIPWFARIPQRTGWRGEWRYGILNDVRHLNKQQYPLMIERFMALGLAPNKVLEKPYPKPQLTVSHETVQETLASINLAMPKTPVLALSPGAEFGPSKRWPGRYYAEVANAKLAQGWQVWLFGSSRDKNVTDEIMRLTQGRCIDVAGRTTLAGTIDLLSLVSGLVTNDSGLMHVAAALDKPLIAIYGSTSPTFTPPLSHKATILQLELSCQPCFKRSCPLNHHHCMEGISAHRVLAAMKNWVQACVSY